MRKHLLSVMLLFCAFHYSKAQYPSPYKIIDTADFYRIYLIDGSFFKGKVKNQGEKALFIQLENGDNLSLDYDIVSARVLVRKEQHILPKGKIIFTSGNYRVLDLNFLIGEDETFFTKNGFAVNASFSAGRRINDHLGIGLGIGFMKSAYFLAPVFVDIRGALWQRNVSPVYNFQIGYGFPFTKRVLKNDARFLQRKGGFYFQPTIGLRFASRGQTNSVIAIGFNFQKNHYTYETIGSSASLTGNIYIIDAYHRNLILKYEMLF